MRGSREVSWGARVVAVWLIVLVLMCGSVMCVVMFQVLAPLLKGERAEMRGEEPPSG